MLNNVLYVLPNVATPRGAEEYQRNTQEGHVRDLQESCKIVVGSLEGSTVDAAAAAAAAAATDATAAVAATAATEGAPLSCPGGLACLLCFILMCDVVSRFQVF